MARLLFGRGARGAIVVRIQEQLTAHGFDTKGHDGVYGGDTVAAVTAFQKARGFQETGGVDEQTWEALMEAPVPPVLDRCLGLTATFEGHGFELAQGNFDGAGVTWGIIGFTLKHGELGKIVNAAFKEDPQLVRDCFGDKTDEVLAILSKPWSKDQEAWANSVSLGAKKVTLAEPYKSGFAKLGRSALGQRLQLERVRDAYYTPARKTAAKFNLTSEVGTALCFDIHVQNGGVKAAAESIVRSKMQDGMSESEVRLLIANAVADNALPEWREDVRNRKVTIAKGSGTVHGLMAELKNWGLDEYEVT
jgi:Putative peptidoglycan binding domain